MFVLKGHWHACAHAGGHDQYICGHDVCSLPVDTLTLDTFTPDTLTLDTLTQLVMQAHDSLGSTAHSQPPNPNKSMHRRQLPFECADTAQACLLEHCTRQTIMKTPCCIHVLRVRPSYTSRGHHVLQSEQIALLTGKAKVIPHQLASLRFVWKAC